MAPRPAVLLWAAVALVSAGLACAPVAAESSQVAPAAPEDLRALAELLDKPSLREWVRQHGSEPASPARAANAPAHQMLAVRLDALRGFLWDLATAVPELPARLDVARVRLASEFRQWGAGAVLLPLLAFMALGALLEQLFWRAMRGPRERIIALPLAEPDERLRALGWRAAYGVGVVGAFTLGSVGAFLLFAWPPLLQRIVLAYLVAFLAVRLTLVGGRVVLAPGAERFRIVPMSTAAARHWFVWSAVLVGLFGTIKATYDLLPTLGVDEAARTLVGLTLGFVLLCLALVAVWTRPRPALDSRTLSHDGLGWLVSVYLTVLWLTTVTGATAPFFIGLVLLLVVLADAGLRAAVRDLARRDILDGGVDRLGPPLGIVALDRLLRIGALLVAGTVVLRILGFDTLATVGADTPAARITRAVLQAALILLLAEFTWQVARAWIDRVVERAGAEGVGGTADQVRHRQRLRTLLPIARNVLLVGLVGIAGLTALASVGIEIGPLIAGAGVVGIAVGFGAQTLVKDVISGMFFLIDDAFRVGEYIESGRIKGTVEAFSLRSVKLRHHRGPLHTVPFGSLSTITNYSRDWVIDKITLGLDYGTDLGKVKSIVKEIGKELQADPEFSPHIIEPLKMQGVDAFGDFAIQVRLKMMTRPGEQFVIRRRAHALIKSAFDREGIRFAYPTVTVAGADNAASAGAAFLGTAGRTPDVAP